MRASLNSDADIDEKRSASIVYITNVPFSRRDYDRYGIAWWRSEGYRVSVLDVGPFALPQRKAEWDRNAFHDISFDHQIVRTGREFDSCRPLLAEADLIVDLTTAHGHTRWNLPILRAIAAADAPSLVISVNAFPGYDAPPGGSGRLADRIKNLFRRLLAADPLNSVICRLPFRWMGVRPADIVVYGGRRSRRAITTVTDATRVIHGHHMDYDLYIDHLAASPQTPPGPDERIVTFIDQDFAGHREFSTNLAVQPIDSDRYYASLRALFDRVERQTGCNVVIARHPHSQTRDLGERLGHRRVIDGETWNLVAGSELIIAHNSAAISMAVMMEKPLLLIFSREIEAAAAWRAGNNAALAGVLERRPMYLEELDALSDEELFGAPTAGFERYLEDYITTRPDRRIKLWPLIAGSLRDEGVISAPAGDRCSQKKGIQ